MIFKRGPVLVRKSNFSQYRIYAWPFLLLLLLSLSLSLSLSLTYILNPCTRRAFVLRDGPRWAPRGLAPPPPPPVQNLFILVIIYLIFVVGPLFHNLRSPTSSISLTSLIQITTIQPKNLTKTIKILTMVIVF